MQALISGQNMVLTNTKFNAELLNTKKSSFKGEIDTSAFLLAKNDKVRGDDDFIFYNAPGSNSIGITLSTHQSGPCFNIDLNQVHSDIDKIALYIEDRQKTKNKLTVLKEKHSSSLVSLEEQHKSYQEELNKVAKEQESLKNLLSELNILKEAENKKAQAREEAEAEEKRRKLQDLLAMKKSSNQKVTQEESSSAPLDDDVVQTSDVRNQRYAKNLNLDVKKIGSSTDGVEIIKYKGEKTIAPLKSFKVVKNFGTYYDPVYKIKLFNESIVLKSDEPKAKVVSVLNGKVVYAKKNAGMLANVVIIQHEGGLHTIYSHLDEISPTLVVGKWIKQGYVVGRVDESLMFQATKDSSHIDPKDLFKI